MTLSAQQVLQDQARQERALRLVAARQAASAVHHRSAQRYRTAKEEQRRAVDADLCKHWQTTRPVPPPSPGAAGSAMAAAAAHDTAQRDRLDEERSAWEAERRLEARRFDLSLQSRRLALTTPTDPECATRRRAAVRSDAAESSRLQHQRRADSVPPGPSPRAVEPASRGDATAVVLAVRPVGGELSSRDRAATHADTREVERERARRAMEQRRLDTQQRAAQRAHAEREMAEALAVEKRRLASMRSEMAEAAARRAHTAPPVDVQEEASRRAERRSREAHKEFESVFLHSDGWRIRDVQTAHPPGVTADAAALLFAPHHDATSLRHCGVGLVHRLIHPVEAAN